MAFKHTSDKCWRDCGLIRYLTHIFWDCPKLSTYWKGIQKQIKKCLGVTILLQPTLIILGIFQNIIQDRSKTYVLKILLVLARK
uniref:Reverse transcriptase zinc-binding domain-containing protein n=1 Tax=Cyprinodon variegatus TaxID=28743 RepID=A0A3Q2DFL4_CYPVA